MAAINLLASLANLSTTARGLVGVKVTAEGLWFDPDEKQFAQPIVEAATALIRQNWREGKAPDGSPLPTVSQATIERRAYRKAQWERDRGKGGRKKRGSGGAEFKAFMADAQRSLGRKVRSRNGLLRRFTASRMQAADGTQVFKPQDPATWGRETGMLGESWAWQFDSGSTFEIYVAAKRGREFDRSGTTAIQRVWPRIAHTLAGLMTQPAMAKAVEVSTRGLIAKRRGDLLRSSMRLLSNLAETAEDIGDAADDVER